MTKTIHPLLSHYSPRKWGEGEGGTYLRGGGAYFKFWPIRGALIRRGGAYLRGGANSRIDGSRRAGSQATSANIQWKSFGKNGIPSEVFLFDVLTRTIEKPRYHLLFSHSS